MTIYSQGKKHESISATDDTGQERRIRGKKPEGSRRLVGGTDGIVWVNTHYTDAKKRTLIKVDMYWPEAALERLPKEERTPERKRDKMLDFGDFCLEKDDKCTLTS